MRWEKWQEFLKERIERIERDIKKLEKLGKEDAEESVFVGSQYILRETREWVDIFNLIERDVDISPEQKFVIRKGFNELILSTSKKALEIREFLQKKKALEIREFLQKELDKIKKLNEIEEILKRIEGIEKR